MQPNLTQTTVPISIGTAIAIQAIIGYDAEGMPLKGKGPLPITQYDGLYVNVRTMIRNFIGSKSSEERIKLTPDDIYYGITADLQIMSEVVVRYGGPQFKVMPYICTFSDIVSRFPKAQWRTANTDNQKQAAKTEAAVLAKVRSIVDATDTSSVLIFDTRMDRNRSRNMELDKTRPRNALIITHQPIDLLSAGEFSNLALLESHTGRIKGALEWNTKLKGYKEDMARLPFNAITLQLWGDAGDMFAPLAPIKIKRRIIELSEKYKWHPMTTPDRMIHGARLDHEPVLASDMVKYNTRF